MKHYYLSLMLLVSTSVYANVQEITQTLLENSAQMISKQQKPSALDALYPHFLVYGFEVSKSAGLGDIFEAEGAFGVEFHYEKVEAP